MFIRATAVMLALSCLISAGAEEFEDYPQFRYMSGLPGGGFAVDADGYVGFDGALQMNIPVAYTPSKGNYVLGYHSSAVNGGLEISFGGDDANGTGILAAGFGQPGRGFYAAAMLTGKGNAGEAAYNFQYQLLAETDNRPAIAIGVVDLLDMRPSKLSQIFEGDGRSFYAVATRSYPETRYPTFWSLGVGSGRFNDRLFGGVTISMNSRLKLLAEYDGWNLNVGGAWDAWSNDQWHAILLGGLTDMDRWTIGATLTRSPD